MRINLDQFKVRQGNKGDIQKLLSLYNEYWESMTGVVKFTLEEFEIIFSAPGFNMESSVHLVTTKEGELVGAVIVMDIATPPIHPNLYGCVRQGFEGHGIGTYMIDWAENRAREAIDRCPEEAKVSMYLQTTQTHTLTIHLFEKLELKPIRYSWFMMKEFEGVQPEPVLPNGIQIKTFKTTSDLETILTSADEAFEDHWGHFDRSGDTERMARFRHSVENDPDFNPDLWYLAMDGNEIAGLALCSPRLGEDREMGVVDTLGVRRPWRRKGLGLALLHHVFSELYDQGFKRAGLGVDTQNLSGATRIYKKAGMHVTHEIAVYEKELRPGVELSKQSD